MRKAAVVIATFGLVVSVAAASGAQVQISPTVKLPSPPAPTVSPSALQRPPTITAVKYAGPRAYVDGAVALEVEVKNFWNKPLESNLLLDRMIRARPEPREGGRLASVPLRIPAGGTATVTISDTKGVDGCLETFDRLTIEGQGSTFVKITPNCMFGMKLIDSSQGGPPDLVVSQRAGKLFYENTSLPFRVPKCDGAIVFETTVKNQASARATSVKLDVTGPDGEVSPFLTPFELAPRAEKTTRAGKVFTGQSGRYVLGLEANGVPVWSPRVKAEVTKLCSLTATLADKVARPPEPAPQRGE